MKCFGFGLREEDVENFFIPIRSKEQIIALLMNAIKVMLLPPVTENAKGQMYLKVDKTSRLFFLMDKKYFSIALPLTVKVEEESLSFSSNYIDDINHKITSDVLGLVTCNDFNESICYLDFMEPLWEEPQEYHPYLWTFIKDLMIFEDGYIRYDYDPEHENGKMHPLHHLDIFYSIGTFKIGLENSIDEKYFTDLLDLEKECMYMKN